MYVYESTKEIKSDGKKQDFVALYLQQKNLRMKRRYEKEASSNPCKIFDEGFEKVVWFVDKVIGMLRPRGIESRLAHSGISKASYRSSNPNH